MDDADMDRDAVDRAKAPADTTHPVDGDRLAEIYDLVGPLYRRVHRKVENDLARDGISVGVRLVLFMLRQQGPMTVPQMGRAQAVSRQYVQRTVNEARDAGLVEAIANPAHKKSSLIRLTDQGIRSVEAVYRREHAELGAVADGLTTADVDACVRVLTRMLTGLGEVDVD